MRHDDTQLLFDLPEGIYDGRGLDGVRTVTWRAGRQLEIACYPITRLSGEATREAKRRRSTPAMAIKLIRTSVQETRFRLMSGSRSVVKKQDVAMQATPTETFEAWMLA